MDNGEILNKLKESIILRGYSKETLKSYLYNCERFLEWIDKSSLNIDEIGVRGYFLFLLSRKYDLSTLRQIRAGIDFMFRFVFRKELDKV